MRTLIAVATLALAAGACSQETTTETPAADSYQAPEPAPPTVIVLTESDARTRLEGDGYTNITGLTQNPDGTWSATGTREGQTTQLTVGESGVSIVTTPAP